LRWVPPRGALGAATGAIAIGTAATSRSTTIIITIATTISTAMSAARGVIGSTTRNTGETLPMGTGKRRISSAPMRASSLGAELEPDQAQAELERGLAAEPELEHVLVAVELELAQVKAELEHVPVVVELELDPVEAVPVPSHPRAQQAAALRTKSVIAAHRPGHPLLGVEDLAVVAETTREPAAPEEVIVWAVAVTVVAEGGIAVAVG
jgi:hypothetical protein